MSNENPIRQFEDEKRRNIAAQGGDAELSRMSLAWNAHSARYKYTYNFSALGRPIIQLPQDMVAIQELVWETRPDLIIETGIAHGGSLILSASLLVNLDYCDAVAAGRPLETSHPRRKVVGIDIDIRPHNRAAIESHPMAHRIEMIQGSSISPQVISQVAAIAGKYERVMVMLDSNHTHDHVLAELRAFAPLVTPGGYCVVFDTVIEDLPEGMFPDRSWSKGNNPKTAVAEFLAEDPRFEVDHAMQSKLLITVAPGGYLRRVR